MAVASQKTDCLAIALQDGRTTCSLHRSIHADRRVHRFGFCGVRRPAEGPARLGKSRSHRRPRGALDRWWIFACANADYISLSIGKAGLRAMTLGLFESLKQKGIHIATVTIHTAVTRDSKEAEAVGEHFWQLHSQPIGKWTAEVKYSG